MPGTLGLRRTSAWMRNGRRGSGSRMATRKRDRDYYRRRLEREHPTIFADLKAGKYGSVRAAAAAAGLIRLPTRFGALKREWNKATLRERREFIDWIKATRTPSRRRIGKNLIEDDGSLKPAVIVEVQAIITRRALRYGQVMDELGAKRLDGSLGGALRQGWRLRSELLDALANWLDTNR